MLDVAKGCTYLKSVVLTLDNRHETHLRILDTTCVPLQYNSLVTRLEKLRPIVVPLKVASYGHTCSGKRKQIEAVPLLIQKAHHRSYRSLAHADDNRKLRKAVVRLILYQKEAKFCSGANELIPKQW